MGSPELQLPIKADSASAEDIGATVNQVVKELGEIDIFAGIMIRETMDNYSLEDFDRMLAVNVRAAFVGIQAVSQAMKDGGRIILIGCNTAVRTAFPGASVYSMTKAALTGWVRGAAIDLAPPCDVSNSIRCKSKTRNALCPAIDHCLPVGQERAYRRARAISAKPTSGPEQFPDCSINASVLFM